MRILTKDIERKKNSITYSYTSTLDRINIILNLRLTMLIITIYST